jgi:type II secretory pathway component GspD/PulD (secretin)
MILPVFSETKSPVINSVKVKEVNNQVKIYIKATDKVDYKVSLMKDPYVCLILETYPAQLDKSAKLTYEVKKGNIKNVKVAQFSDNPDIVRVVVNLEKDAAYEVNASKDKKSIAFTVNNEVVSKTAGSDNKTEPVKVNEQKPTVAAQAKTVKESAPAVKKIVKEKPVTTTNTAQAVVKKVSKPEPKKAVEEKPVVKKKVAVKKQAKPKTFDLNCENEDINDVLKTLAKKTGQNIIYKNNLTGTVTANLTNITLDRALQIVTQLTNLSYKKMENIYIVDTAEALDKLTDASFLRGGNEIVEVIPLTYMKPADMISQVKASAQDISISENARLNAVVLRGPSELTSYVKNIIQQYDQLPPETPVSAMKTEMIRLNYSKPADIQTLVQTWFPGTSMMTDDRLNAIIIKGDPSNLDAIKSFIAKIDKSKKQVEIDVKVVQLTEAASKSIGVTWPSSIVSTNLREAVPTGVPYGQGAYQIPTFVDLPFQTFVRDPLTLAVAVNYQVSKGSAKVLASPKLLTLSGEKGKLTIGQNYPITYPDPRAGTLQAENVNIAIMLEVTPTVMPDGYVSAEIVSDNQELGLISQGVYPQSTDRKVTTNLIIKDGQTAVMGGLYHKNEDSTFQKVPLLGDLPVIGDMFKANTLTKDITEIVLMITPRVIVE